MSSKGLHQESYILSSRLAIILKDYNGLWIEIKTEHLPTQQAQVPSLQSIFIKLHIFLAAVYFLSLIALSLPPNYKLDCKEKSWTHLYSSWLLAYKKLINLTSSSQYTVLVRITWTFEKSGILPHARQHIREHIHCLLTISSCAQNNDHFFLPIASHKIWRVSNYLIYWQRKQVREQTPFLLPIRKKRKNTNICAVH